MALYTCSECGKSLEITLEPRDKKLEKKVRITWENYHPCEQEVEDD